MLAEVNKTSEPGANEFKNVLREYDSKVRFLGVSLIFGIVLQRFYADTNYWYPLLFVERNLTL